MSVALWSDLISKFATNFLHLPRDDKHTSRTDPAELPSSCPSSPYLRVSYHDPSSSPQVSRTTISHTPPISYFSKSQLSPPVASVAKVYANVCESVPPSYSDWENFEISWIDGSNYHRQHLVGHGKYSHVYSAVRQSDGRLFAIKYLKAVRARKFRREVLILQNLRHGPNIIEAYGCFFSQETAAPAIVFKYIRNDDWKELYPTLTQNDVRHYMFQLLRSLDFCHSRGIMHRDVKPQNILIDHQTRELRLIDWGLAEFYVPGQDYSLRVASRYYKAPEILLGYRHYDYSFDMWSVGCVFAAMILRVEVMFKGQSDLDQLRTIMDVLGGCDLHAYVRKYGMQLSDEVACVVDGSRHKRIPFQEYASDQENDLAIEPTLDLMDHLLRYDHQDRFTAREALRHRYFRPQQVNSSPKSMLGYE
ncbi:casein kinase 2 alpha subunit [Phlyctochytrium arcticum]|nr:casein kinase 2 alpha subunit [Phlyctochytrium arcticum]